LKTQRWSLYVNRFDTNCYPNLSKINTTRSYIIYLHRSESCSILQILSKYFFIQDLITFFLLSSANFVIPFSIHRIRKGFKWGERPWIKNTMQVILRSYMTACFACFALLGRVKRKISLTRKVDNERIAILIQRKAHVKLHLFKTIM